MLFHKILVPYDNSKPAKHALKEAVKLASSNPATKIIILDVLVGEQEFLTFGGFGNVTPVEKPAVSKKKHDSLIDTTRASTKKATLPIVKGIKNKVDIRVVFASSPADGILDAIDEFGCDHVVMGSRGLGAVRGALGSVSYSVLRSSKVPVTVVK